MKAEHTTKVSKQQKKDWKKSFLYDFPRDTNSTKQHRGHHFSWESGVYESHKDGKSCHRRSQGYQTIKREDVSRIRATIQRYDASWRNRLKWWHTICQAEGLRHYQNGVKCLWVIHIFELKKQLSTCKFSEVWLMDQKYIKLSFRIWYN